jgi:hypothetical protein
MTTSALRFRGESLYVEDPELREFLKAVAYHLQDYPPHDSATVDWLVEACASWMDTHEDFPPGLRDLELDEVLTTPERLEGFGDYLSWLQRITPPSDTYDAQTAHRVMERVLSKWGVLYCAGVSRHRPPQDNGG